jgi:hypothetical protein
VGLGGKVLGAIVSAPGAIANVVGPFVTGIVGWFLGIPGKLVSLGLSIVGAIIGGMASFPGAVADVVRKAFANLKIDVGPFHIRSTGITIDLPKLGPTGPTGSQGPYGGMTNGGGYNPYNHAAGGWAGLHGPELSWLGERGPEYVIPNHQLGGGVGGSPVVIQLTADGRKLGELIDERLYYAFNRSAPALGRG